MEDNVTKFAEQVDSEISACDASCDQSLQKELDELKQKLQDITYMVYDSNSRIFQLENDKRKLEDENENLRYELECTKNNMTSLNNIINEWATEVENAREFVSNMAQEYINEYTRVEVV